MAKGELWNAIHTAAKDISADEFFQTLVCRFSVTCVGLVLPVLLTVACLSIYTPSQCFDIAYNEAESATTAARSHTHRYIVLFLNNQLIQIFAASASARPLLALHCQCFLT